MTVLSEGVVETNTPSWYTILPLFTPLLATRILFMPPALPQSWRLVTYRVILLLAGCCVANPCFAGPLLFESTATIVYDGESGGAHYYNYMLSSTEQPYRELYLVLDPAKVLPAGAAMPAVGSDAFFLDARLLSHPDVDLFLSSDHRSFANMNNPALLNENDMLGYDPNLTDALPEDTFALSIRFSTNRALARSEMYRVGYWAGDLRGIHTPGMPFTESDGVPDIPEPATWLLTSAGLLTMLRRRAWRWRRTSGSG